MDEKLKAPRKIAPKAPGVTAPKTTVALKGANVKMKAIPSATQAEINKTKQALDGTAWGRLLGKGPKGGSAATDAKGRLLATVANLGLQQGDTAIMDPKEGCRGFAIRVVEAVTPLLSHQLIASAMEVIGTGGDLQRAVNVLRHDNVGTVRALIKGWHELWNLPVPAEYAEESVDTLSSSAQRRLAAKRTDALPCGLIVEACGTNQVGEPLVPPEWIGRAFESGEDLHTALAKEGASLTKLATFAMTVGPKEEWIAPDSLRRSLEARSLDPFAVVSISATPVLHVDIIPVDLSNVTQKIEATGRAMRCRALGGAETQCEAWKAGSRMGSDGPVVDVSATTIVLAVEDVLLESQDRRREVRTDGSREETDNPLSAILTSPSTTAKEVVYPASLLQKTIRRGKELCSANLVIEALTTLLHEGTVFASEFHYQRSSGTRLALSRVLTAVFEDVGPYLPDGEVLSIPDLMGLTFIAHSDPDFRLPPDLQRRLCVTALRLHGNDDASALWPWRGWGWSCAGLRDTTRIEGGSSSEAMRVRDALRCMALFLPVTRVERTIMLRYLGSLGSSVWENAMRPLEPCQAEKALRDDSTIESPPPPSMATRDKETRLAAFDSQWRPSMLLFLQACLPCVPKEASQHSLKALAEVVWRLSSGVNARVLKQRLSGAAQETYRFLSFVTEGAARPGEEHLTPNAMGIFEGRGMAKKEAEKVDWKSARDGQRLTTHETLLLDAIQAIQVRLHAFLRSGMYPVRPGEPFPLPPSLATDDVVAPGEGRPPTSFEARTAFLQLFGAREALTVKGQDGKQHAVLVTLAGKPSEPFLVQRVSGVVEGRRERDVDDVVRRNAERAFLDVLKKGRQVRPGLPPPGFSWKLGGKDLVTVKLDDSEGELTGLVEGTVVPLFDAGALLQSCALPVATHRLPPVVARAVSQALYAHEEGDPVSDGMQLLESLDQTASKLREMVTSDEAFSWSDIAMNSRLPASVWRDLVIKLVTREGGAIEINRCSRDGGRLASAVQQLSEGVMLRVLCALQVVYPNVLRRTGEARYQVNPVGAQFVHFERMVHTLAFGSFDDGATISSGPLPTRTSSQESLSQASRVSEADSEGSRGSGESDSDSEFSFEGTNVDSTVAQVTTKLWKHQKEACEKVMDGIVEGRRGFADASAVGAGKSLTAVACCLRVAKWLKSRRIPRQGFLVLVPNNDLIHEWVQQILLHTEGVHVLVQQPAGHLVSRGVSAAGSPPTAHGSTKRQSKQCKIDPNTIVITTLARARDKPFVSIDGWDLVVIDECLSIQNDSALQTTEAWRQVAASRCGVLMLSATFFRSRFSKLFYMIRMLRSSLPRTEAYLPALLAEHIICYVPERKRTWKLQYRPVPLAADAHKAYRARLLAAVRAQKDPRLVYMEVKGILRRYFERTTLLEAFKTACDELVKNGRKPLIFANGEPEAKKLLEVIPNARAWNDEGKKATGPLVLTVHRGAYGLNLQNEADAIISRPQPGDIIEQMKGRVDRPGQVAKELHMVVLYAMDTIEEAEAANIRLCGAFFRQYLDPLSKAFQERAVEAAIAATQSNHVPPRRGAQQGKSAPGAVAAAFHRQLEAVSKGLEVVERPDDDGEDKEEEEAATPSPTAVQQRGTKRSAKAVQKAPRKATVKAAKESKSGTKRPSDGKSGSPAKKKKENTPSESQSAREEESESDTDEELPVVPKRMDQKVAIDALAWLSQRDPKLATVISTIGPPTSLVSELGSGSSFKALVRSIVYQQLSTKSAAKIFARVIEVCGGTNFTARDMINAPERSLRAAGLSQRKLEYILGVARLFASGELSDAKLDAMDDDQVLSTLQSIKGMGEWSTHMFMMFQLGRPDVLPVGDLAIRKAFQKLYGLATHDGSETAVQYLPKAAEIHRIAKKWRPYRTIGSWYMWHIVETKEAAYTFG